MDEIISNPNILGGTPCFAGTRVPVDAFFDHLRRGYTIDYFIAQFPTVTRAQAEAVLDNARRHIPLDARRVAG
ncbi:MAG: DUF433 domain-containing protein [Phycisphaeraceae bacterium]|nr:DUF433 domain-containing protein [Phycisphaeraceae bacterium]MBX3368489.1 DUF433 domain-containing protein [Phycisphaeraceae bacterium]QYK47616.1 MAG: DUF433 domain-containing protein [Phycisphaeraceae bacterium]